MRVRVAFLQLLLAIAIASGFTASPALGETLPLSAYGDLPTIERMALSPSGKRVAMVGTFSGKRVLAVVDENSKPVRSFAIGDTKVRSIDYVTEDVVMLRRSVTQDLGYGFTADKHEFYQAFLFNVADGNTEQVFGDRANLIKATFGFYGIRMVDGSPHAFFGALEMKKRIGSRLEYEFDHGRPALYSVNLVTNRSKRVAMSPPPRKDRSWLIAKDGTVLVTLDNNDETGSWILYSGSTTVTEGTNNTSGAWPISIGRDGSTVIYAIRNEQSAIIEWYEVPVDASAAPVEVFADMDVDGLYKDQLTGELIGFYEENDEIVSTFYDENKTAQTAKIRSAFGSLNTNLVDWTRDFGHVIVRTNGNGDSGSYFKVDLAALKASALAYERPAITPPLVGAISTVSYKAADGLDLDGILTLPPGKEAKGLPLIMLPHGGPHSHDSATFDWWAQAFASRGYAVFQPNFRGSTNRDQAFKQAGYGEWGRKMQTDLSDGITALAEKGIVDPKRACIVGASYGGYAALAGVTLQQGLYRCAVSVAGVSDVSLMQRIERYESDSKVTARSLELQLGPKSRYKEISPRNYAAQADAPILLIHGRDDTVVAYNQSTKMAEALKDAGKPYEFVELEGEDHWLSLGETRRAMLDATMRFVLKHNPPQ